MERHPLVTWEDIEAKLSKEHLQVIGKMEETSGEPDVIQFPDGRLAYVDCYVDTER